MSMTRDEIEEIKNDNTLSIKDEDGYGYTHSLRELCNLALLGLDAQWQPIETAPMDGTSILAGLWVKRTRGGKTELIWECFVGGVNEDGEFIDDNGSDFGWLLEDLEYWKPLPQPPKES